MKITRRIVHWLEIRFCAPAYSGWVLGGISICFFGAAINTMAGWLYVLSGISCALLFVAAMLPPRSLSGLAITRQPIEPVTVGDDLVIRLDIRNQAKKGVNWLKVEDRIPFLLGKPVSQAIDFISPQTTYQWEYRHPAQRRGVYRWQNIDLISGAPLGLFWCRRSRACNAIAYVYPQVLNLATCPLLDEIGRDDSRREEWLGNPDHAATEGLVRAVRPYRIGDPIRLVHWRSSARHGELRVRELETITGGQDVIIALDTATVWDEANFESAATTAASLFFYAQKQGLKVQLWTAATGLISGNQQVLTALAATHPLESATHDIFSPKTISSPIVWLTQTQQSPSTLPFGSRRILWTANTPDIEKTIVKLDIPGIIIDPEKPLKMQLQM